MDVNKLLKLMFSVPTRKFRKMKTLNFVMYGAQKPSPESITEILSRVSPQAFPSLRAMGLTCAKSTQLLEWAAQHKELVLLSLGETVSPFEIPKELSERIVEIAEDF